MHVTEYFGNRNILVGPKHALYVNIVYIIMRMYTEIHVQSTLALRK